jgi:hypothetical protein
MILTGGNRRTRRKTCPSATLSTTNPTWIGPGAKPGLRGERPATNHPSHGDYYVRKIFRTCSLIMLKHSFACRLKLKNYEVNGRHVSAITVRSRGQFWVNNSYPPPNRPIVTIFRSCSLRLTGHVARVRYLRHTTVMEKPDKFA